MSRWRGTPAEKRLNSEIPKPAASAIAIIIRLSSVMLNRARNTASRTTLVVVCAARTSTMHTKAGVVRRRRSLI
jgi:hypothetical protein